MQRALPTPRQPTRSHTFVHIHAPPPHSTRPLTFFPRLQACRVRPYGSTPSTMNVLDSGVDTRSDDFKVRSCHRPGRVFVWTALVGAARAGWRLSADT
jgi:hypothetical protein